MSETGMVPYVDLQKMAEAVVGSRLFPSINTVPQALTLFMVAQAEGLHPIQAMRRYHIIQGQVSLRTDTMLANFMARGGKVEWVKVTTTECEAVFDAPGLSKPLSYRWTMEDAGRAGLAGKDNWKKDPRAMLKARVISGGLRLADPASVVGLYAPEEVQDFEPRVVATEAEIVPPEPPQEARKALAGGEAEGEAVISGGGIEPEPEPPVSIFEAPQAVPGHCTLKGCGAELGLYQSTQEKHRGREYWQCEKAHAMVDQALLDGSTPKVAAILASAHFRQWLS